MNIYLIRHGKAEPASPLKKDRDRELTDEGTKIVKVSVEMWKDIINNFDAIATSPYKRAVQTAKIIANTFNFQDEILKDSSLMPGSDLKSIINLVKTLKVENIALIGHQPDLGYHISKLVCGAEINLKLSPASITRIFFEGSPKVGTGILELLLQPYLPDT